MIRSTCPYCGVGCGVLLAPAGESGLIVRGDPDHPANRGRLCSKGTALGETVGRSGRLSTPEIHGRPADWDQALSLIATRFRQTIAAHGPESVALYLSGQMLTEDYYVANKLMKGFIGSANVDTNSRLCMASTVAGHARAFGADTVPGIYDDLEEADLIVLVGSNLAWCHPVLWQRIEAARATRGTKIVVIDPRRSVTAGAADLHLPIAPGADVALFNRLLAALADRELLTSDATGLEAAVQSARADSGETGLGPADLARFLDLWCRTEKVVTVFSQGVNQSSSGTDKVNAILNCHLATGRIGRPGMGPFSVTGQPNAMGGREVGGLANQLACHLSLENPAHRAAVAQFWRAPRMAERPGLKAVDLFRAVGDGRVKALWIIHTNPAVTLPEADAVRAAIAACEFVAVSDVTGATDTARLAHVLLPAAAWAEKSGTVTNSDRTISRQRAVLVPPGAARPDWWMLAGVARRMGFDGFDWPGPAAIFREHAALSGIAGALGRDFDISGKAAISDADYDRMEPFRWPSTALRQGGRFFGDSRYFTPDGRPSMIAVTSTPPQAMLTPEHPFRLNTGRIRDQWHTMTRTGQAPRLNQHLGEPFVEVHPSDALRSGLSPWSLAEVRSVSGNAVLRVVVTDRVRPRQIFAPMHWTGETAPTGRIDAVVSAVTDPLSGQPESKAAAVSLRPWPARWFAFACAAGSIAPDGGYWARRVTETGLAAELALLEAPDNPLAFARALFDLPDAEVMQTEDAARGQVSIALILSGRVVALLFAAPSPVMIARDAAIARIGMPRGAATLAPCAGGSDRADNGPLVCACTGVGRNRLQSAFRDGACDLAAIGQATGAGTNCGACRPEIAAMLAQLARPQAAE
ncbi:assimilatory nitrate reductase (NADH) alpha subunit apoprotein [Gemmobacter caeni]|uniref:Assimilatory nitrate reductase (NADH) alpha subunit apoprotein n=1 Tax=Gemmobacter caeni TaxID=589035 RepID=A0A2T6AWT4_9RHOB|nr:nitrate reductase [Gemmobacter caeni]PTX48241.1 assimilatory nitrate reductase (NADH) alpha subunit apoprotein [Gemmobacter caeni]TWI96893.1 assimilatory nitrate reductase (NADH) alpha subunit apoprotein [Gemmobacter caeni]